MADESTPDRPRPDEPQLPALDEARSAEVRRLLASARHAGPMPPEVTARMDAVLAGLVTERASSSPGTGQPGRPGAVPPPGPGPAPIDHPGPDGEGGTNVVPLRRRRRAQYLLAAAAVAAIGFGTFAVIDRASDETGAVAGRSQSEQVQREDDAAVQTPGESGAQDEAPGAPPTQGAPPDSAFEPTVPQDPTPPPVLDALDAESLAALDAQVQGSRLGLVTEAEAERVGCGPASLASDARLVFAEHGGASVLVSFHTEGETTVVEVYGCSPGSTDAPLASVVLQRGE